MLIERRLSPIEDLPYLWSNILQGDTNFGINDENRFAYVNLAQRLHYQFFNGNLDLFQKRNDLNLALDRFVQVLASLAYESLDYFSKDFLRKNYPDLSQFSKVINQGEYFSCYNDQWYFVVLAKIVFSKFGYNLPASVYWFLLSSLEGTLLCDISSNNNKDNTMQRVFESTHRALVESEIYVKVIQICALNYGFMLILENGKLSIIRINHFSHISMPDIDINDVVRKYLFSLMCEYTFYPFTPHFQY